MSENKRYFTYEYLKDYFGFPAGAQPSESIDRLVMRNHTSNSGFAKDLVMICKFRRAILT